VLGEQRRPAQQASHCGDLAVAQIPRLGRRDLTDLRPDRERRGWIANKATGSITDEWFTSNNEPLSVTRGYGTAAATTETFSYDSGARLLAATDGKGHTTTYGYNAQGDQTSEKDAEGNETKWAFNAAHQLISTTTPGGETTTIERDANGNVESISRPGPEETTQMTSFEYDEDGQLESITDPLERTWTYAYNLQGDRISESDPLGSTQTLGYDGDSRLTSIITPRGNAEGAEAAEFETTIERDLLGRPLKATDPLGGSVEYAYDPNGNLESKTNPNGHTTTYAYDPDNQQIEVEKPNGAVLQTEYDGEGNVASQIDANEDATTYIRNALGQPVEVIDPLGRKTIEEFDAAGNLKAMIDPAERKASYAYDKADRLIEVDYSEGATPDAKFEYDPDGNVTKMVDGTGESTFAYDVLGRLRESEDGHGSLVGYGYNLAEELTAIAYPNGKGISRTFDKAGRLETVTDWLGGTTAFSYDSDSNLEAIAFPAASGNVDEYVYDNAGRMSAAKFTSGPETLASLSYLRDPAGQIEEEAVSGLPGSATISYGYDENERLVEAGEASFEYDPADNLTEAPGTVNIYDPASQLEAGTGVSYTYDKLGERTKTTPEAGPATTYDYDQAGNLISVERPEEGEVSSINESLAYDATGLIASKISGLTTRYLTWDNSGALPLLLSDEENSYIYGPNGLTIEQISAEEKPSYLHHDQLGSTRMLTDSAGEEAGAFSYAPFGGLEASTGAASTPMGFAGQYTDQQTGLQYLRARFYDPATAQFLTKDPLTAVLRTPYGYANENPLRYIDPSGMSCVGADHFGPGIPYPTVNPVDCASDLGGGAGAALDAGGDAAGFAVDKSSLLIPPIVFAACLVEESWCTPAVVGGAAAGIGANGIKASKDPCFNFWSTSIRDLLVNIAAALPGGVFAATAGRAGPELTPLARRIIQ
jgi:RHS repeat-associated protein